MIDTCGSSTSQLCSRCEILDFGRYFKLGITIALRPLGTILEDSWQTRCPVCRLFASARIPAPVYETTKGPFYELWSFADFSSTKKPRRPSVKRNPTILGVVHESYGKLSSSDLCRVNGVYMIDPSRSLRRQFPCGKRLILPQDIDYERLRGWLSQCDTTHRCMSATFRVKRFDGIRVIDCFTREIVRLQPNEVYCALSYVWGAKVRYGSNDNLPRRGKKLSSRIPKVIEDAMTVVREISQRYLWVDQYCIDQHDMVDRQTTISSMDRIYESAYITIVAASGVDANHGLPGVSSTARILPFRAVWEGKLLLSSLPRVSDALKQSTWATRSWTYQEAVLSRRLLCFTSHQIYFICSSQIYHEESSRPQRRHRCCSSNRNSNEIQKLIFQEPDDEHMTSFTSHLKQYTSRDLTFDYDALNAFRGILARCAWRSYWGVPILSPGNQFGFAKGLQWIPDHAARATANSSDQSIEPSSFSRRKEFPSWSWAGWKGQVLLQSSDELTTSSALDPEIFFVAEICPENQDGKLLSLDELQNGMSLSSSRIIPELTPYLHIRAPGMSLRLRWSMETKRHRIFLADLPWYAHIQTPGISLVLQRSTRENEKHNAKELARIRAYEPRGSAYLYEQWEGTSLTVDCLLLSPEIFDGGVLRFVILGNATKDVEAEDEEEDAIEDVEREGKVLERIGHVDIWEGECEWLRIEERRLRLR